MTNLTAEQTEKLERYVELLRKWQKTINLVSNSTLGEAWERHILDSAQLAEYIPQNAKILDLGSGAGFPGLVLAIMRPDLNVTLVESDVRKCAFLQTVSRETSALVTVLNQRIEEVAADLPVAVITARALASLEQLLGFMKMFHVKHPELFGLFLKGEKAEEELEAARKTFDFNVEVFPSQTSSQARILKINFV